MSRRWLALAVAICGLALGVGLWIQSSRDRSGVQTQRNLVVVMGCTLRRDQLSPYGGPESLTPWMAGFAREGVVFEDLIASSSWTKESSTAIFTGSQAASVGMIEPRIEHSQRVLSPLAQTLAERLQSAGWFTAGVTANPHLNSTYGLAQGFDSYRDTASAGFAKRNKIPGSEVVALGLKLLDQRPDPSQPVYLRLVLIDPHSPVDVPKSEIDAQLGPGVPRRLAQYRAGVARVDQALAELDRGLRDRGLTADNTYLVLLTDHGEGLSMPEHHRGQHGRVLYPNLTSVPWILRGPDIEPHRITGLASHLDIMPTLLGLLGVPSEEALVGSDWSNLTHTGPAHTDRTEAYTETWYFGARRAARITTEQACQQDFGSKSMAKSQFVPGCFDRDTDPDWTSPRANPASQRALAQWHKDRFAEYEAWPDTTNAPFAIGTTQSQLEALGYVE